jgi:hypothetical protein
VELVEQALAGDRQAWAGIWDLHGPRLHAYARNLLGHEQDANDAVADTFVSAAEHLAELRDAEALRPVALLDLPPARAAALGGPRPGAPGRGRLPCRCRRRSAARRVHDQSRRRRGLRPAVGGGGGSRTGGPRAARARPQRRPRQWRRRGDHRRGGVRGLRQGQPAQARPRGGRAARRSSPPRGLRRARHAAEQLGRLLLHGVAQADRPPRGRLRGVRRLAQDHRRGAGSRSPCALRRHWCVPSRTAASRAPRHRTSSRCPSRQADRRRSGRHGARQQR